MPFSAKSLFASGDVIPAATLSMTNEDPDYPVENAQNDDAADTAKATGTSTVVTITVASSTPRVYAIVNTNGTSIALTNGAGMASQAQTVPSRTLDGKQRNGVKDMDGVALRTSTTFTLTMSKTGSAPLEFGRIVLATALDEFLWSPGVEFGHTRYGSVRNRTRLGSLARRFSPVAAPRTGSGQFEDLADLETLLDLEALANGLGRGFLVIPDRTKNDALFVQPSEDKVQWTDQGGSMVFRLPLEEISMGLPPALT